MSRKIIPNIPEIDYYGNEVDYIFNLLEATFAGTGDKIDKAELAVYSGLPNRFVWTDGAWVFGNEVIDSIDETPFETKLRLLKTIGWQAKYISVLRSNDGKPLNMDNEQIRQDFVDSIDRGYPILAKYTSNHKHYNIIGYEDNGNKIVYKSMDETVAAHISSETAALENWEDTVTEYILLKEKNKPAPERERVLDILKLIVNRARRTDEINGKKVGFAAWESYLNMLEHNDFSALPLHLGEDDSVQGRMYIYCDGLCQIDARNNAIPYYRSLVEKFPDWRKELETAITAMEACAKYGGFLWTQGFSMDENGYEKFRDPAARKILADEGRRAMQKDIEAIEQFEKILRYFP